jgi:hypothetical protein
MGLALVSALPQDSRQHYEMEYRHRAANLEKCMSELWRMERKRDKNAREMKVRGWGTPSTSQDPPSRSSQPGCSEHGPCSSGTAGPRSHSQHPSLLLPPLDIAKV